MNPCTAVIVACQLCFGALNTLATKVTFQIKAYDLDGHLETFEKPWFGVYRMFQGMAFILILHLYTELRNWSARNRQRADGYTCLDGNGAEALAPPATPLKAYFLVALPTVLDLFGTVCTYVGLFYNSA